jgi:hypothetical protein
VELSALGLATRCRAFCPQAWASRGVEGVRVRGTTTLYGDVPRSPWPPKDIVQDPGRLYRLRTCSGLPNHGLPFEGQRGERIATELLRTGTGLPRWCMRLERRRSRCEPMRSRPRRRRTVLDENRSAPRRSRGQPPRNGAAPLRLRTAPPRNGAAPLRLRTVPPRSGTAPLRLRTAPPQNRAEPLQTRTVPPQIRTSPPQNRGHPPRGRGCRGPSRNRSRWPAGKQKNFPSPNLSPSR